MQWRVQAREGCRGCSVRVWEVVHRSDGHPDSCRSGGEGGLGHWTVVENCQCDQKQTECPAERRGRRGNTAGSHRKRRGSISVVEAVLRSVVGSYHVEGERPRTFAQGLERHAEQCPVVHEEAPSEEMKKAILEQLPSDFITEG